MTGDSHEYKISSNMVMTPFNQQLLTKEKDYNNPLVLEKFIDAFGLDEIGSNYPTSLYNPHDKQPEDFIEELQKRQTELLQA